ncbi:hypothetical protein DFP72DRAFT_1173808 [Ephemerocybe angulata]|uniref:C2H2-type domain-containing protein n=1 Tax=Ephemerocybe angulata TaxID=980116 RepID=A0A8H6LYS4_9AGAR|nr:hypothetical protein DFP72DRAFT_1173808 [Tulosesus angulatus]
MRLSLITALAISLASFVHAQYKYDSELYERDLDFAFEARDLLDSLSTRELIDELVVRGGGAPKRGGKLGSATYTCPHCGQQFMAKQAYDDHVGRCSPPRSPRS